MHQSIYRLPAQNLITITSHPLVLLCIQNLVVFRFSLINRHFVLPRYVIYLLHIINDRLGIHWKFFNVVIRLPDGR